MEGSIEHHGMEDMGIDDDSVRLSLEAVCNHGSVKAAITKLDYVDIFKCGI